MDAVMAAIVVAAITGLCAVVGTWLTMRGAAKSAEAIIIGSYTKLVNDLQSEINRLNVKQSNLESAMARLEGVVSERDKHIDRLTFALSNVLSASQRSAI